MNDFLLRFSRHRAGTLLLLALLLSGSAWAQDASGTVSLDEAGLTEGTGYTLETNGRSFWYSNATNLVTSHDADVAQLDATDSAAVFGFVTFDGGNYIYSVGQHKFLQRNTTLGAAGNPVYIFDTKSGDDFHYFFAFDPNKRTNINDNGSSYVFNSYNAYDKGNQFKLTPTAISFDVTTVKTQLATQLTAEVKASLLEEIEKAKALGIDVTEAQAVYDNPLATVSDVTAATSALIDAESGFASPTNPTDLTSKIVNPYFEENCDGWESTAPDNIQTKTDVNNTMEFPPAFTGKSWMNNSDNGSFRGMMHQVVTGLPLGVYKVRLAAYVSNLDRNNLKDSVEYVFANDSKKLIDSATPKIYNWFAVVTDGTLDLGLAQDSVISSRMYIDNAGLTYYGNTLASYQYMGTALKEEVDSIYGEGTSRVFSSSYLEAVHTVADEVTAAQSPEDAEAAYRRGLQAEAALATNANYFDEVSQQVTDLDYYIYQLGFEMVDYQDQLNEIYENRSATNEELATLLGGLHDQEVDFIKKNIQGVSDLFPNGQEYPFIENSSFDGGSTAGWNLTGAEGGGGASGVEELWNKHGFSMHQDFTGMKPGLWRFQIEGFYRTGGSGEGTSNWNNAQGENKGGNTIYSYFGINNRSTTFPNWAAHGLDMAALGYTADTDPRTTPINYKNRNDDWWVRETLWRPEGNVDVWLPDRIYGADDYFTFNDDYVKSAIGFVGPDGKLQIRIYNTDYDDLVNIDWTLIGDTHLYYLGAEADSIRPYLQALVDTAAATLTQPMAGDVKTALQKAYDAALPVVSGSDGDDMIAKYADLEQAIINTRESVRRYATLNIKVNELLDAIDIYEETASQESRTAATALYTEVAGKISGGTYALDEIPAVIDEIDQAIYNLKIPTGTATDDEPQDWTFTIQNPLYLDGTTGWTMPNSTVHESPDYGMNVAEGYNTLFNTYQDIYKLPAGTYKVTVQGFYRQRGSNDNALSFQLLHAQELGKTNLLSAEALKAYPYVNRGRFYANGDTITAKDLCFIPETEAEGYILTSALGEGGWTTYVDSLTTESVVKYYYPDNCLRAASRFADGLYVNEVYTQVGEDGHLRIGACNTDFLSIDWMPFSNWTLTYYGTHSKHADATGIDGISSQQKVVGRKVYTIDGRLVNGLQPGINIVRTTTADGKTTVKKIIVK